MSILHQYAKTLTRITFNNGVLQNQIRPITLKSKVGNTGCKSAYDSCENEVKLHKPQAL